MKTKPILRAICLKTTGIKSPRRLLDLIWFWICERFSRPDPAILWDGKLDFVRLRLTSMCNARCRFCNYGHLKNAGPIENMNIKWLYESCAPLYEKLKWLHFSHGECLLYPGLYDFCKYMGENFHRVNLGTESNGIAFTKNWQEFATENLFNIHFSMNAVTLDTYLKGVWCSDFSGGDEAFKNSRKNLEEYVNLLKSKDRLCFAPAVSMVINKNTYHEVRDFCTWTLASNARCCSYYFDFTENHMSDELFNDDYNRKVLIELMKMQKVLKDKLLFSFRLFVPLKELASAQAIVDAISRDEIQNEYADLLKLAEERSIVGEYEEREAWRAKLNKHSLTLSEDLQTTMHQLDMNKKKVCFVPWRSFEIHPDGGFSMCGWLGKMSNIMKKMDKSSVNWDKIMNSLLMRYWRAEMLKGNYKDCMHCCPLNPTYKPISTNIQYSVSDLDKYI